MKIHEILEYNKRCAEFLGYKYYPYPDKDPGWRKEKGHLKLLQSDGSKYFLARTTSKLKFHSDWNLIMEVVDKIESLGYSITMDQYKKVHRVYFNCDKTMEEVSNGSTDLNRKIATCEAINQFLIWYESKNI